jgi:hypothetical protein
MARERKRVKLAESNSVNEEYRKKFEEDFGECTHFADNRPTEDDFDWDGTEDQVIQFSVECNCGIHFCDNVESEDDQETEGKQHDHYDWKSVYEERQLAERLAEIMQGCSLPSEGDEGSFDLLHFTHPDGGKVIGDKTFYMIDPNADGLVTVETLNNDVLKNTVHPTLVKNGGDCEELEERWANYVKMPKMFENLNLDEADEEDEEDEEEDEEEEKDEEDEEDPEHRRKARRALAAMKRFGLKRLTWIVMFDDGIPFASPYPVYLMGVSPKTGNLVGMESTVTWT